MPVKEVIIDGIRFDSSKEGERYVYLLSLSDAQAITDLKLQPKFTLQEGFQYQTKNILPITYTADFQYTLPDGTIIIEDVKPSSSFRFNIDKWRIIKKLFLRLIATEQHIHFHEIYDVHTPAVDQRTRKKARRSGAKDQGAQGRTGSHRHRRSKRG